MISYSLLFILLSLLRAKPPTIHSHSLLILKIYSQAEPLFGLTKGWVPSALRLLFYQRVRLCRPFKLKTGGSMRDLDPLDL